MDKLEYDFDNLPELDVDYYSDEKATYIKGIGWAIEEGELDLKKLIKSLIKIGYI